MTSLGGSRAGGAGQCSGSSPALCRSSPQDLARESQGFEAQKDFAQAEPE